MKKNDVILAVALLVVAATIFVVLHFTKEKGQNVLITVDGKEYATVSLKEEQTIVVENEYGSNTIVIKSSTVSVSDADCENHLCISQGKIENSGETIVCLPHKLIITIE